MQTSELIDELNRVKEGLEKVKSLKDFHQPNAVVASRIVRSEEFVGERESEAVYRLIKDERRRLVDLDNGLMIPEVKSTKVWRRSYGKGDLSMVADYVDGFGFDLTAEELDCLYSIKVKGSVPRFDIKASFGVAFSEKYKLGVFFLGREVTSYISFGIMEEMSVTDYRLIRAFWGR